MRNIVQKYPCKAKLTVTKASDSRVVFVKVQPNGSPDVQVDGDSFSKLIQVQLYTDQLPGLIEILQKVVAIAEKDGTFEPR
jgi:hypothetical protein